MVKNCNIIWKHENTYSHLADRGVDASLLEVRGVQAEQEHGYVHHDSATAYQHVHIRAGHSHHSEIASKQNLNKIK